MKREIISDLDNIFKSLQSFKLLHNYGLIDLIKQSLSINPYQSINYPIDYDQSSMWKEQSMINFPILYLASIYLYIYAKKKKCTTFLFATRDCCHWYRIFNRLFPHCHIHYFHCSRNMFEKAIQTGNHAYDDYIKSIVKHDLDKVIYIDIHGTCKRMFSYFSKKYGNVPHGFLLSSAYKKYSSLPLITKAYKKKGKFINLVFDTRGSPCESLNYDSIGTLQDFSEKGPVRDKLEYCSKLIEPYHKCIDFLVDQIHPLNKDLQPNTKVSDLLNNLLVNIKKIFTVMSDKNPTILKYTNHVRKHKKKLPS